MLPRTSFLLSGPAGSGAFRFFGVRAVAVPAAWNAGESEHWHNRQSANDAPEGDTLGGVANAAMLVAAAD
jgi:hypothetical protein